MSVVRFDHVAKSLPHGFWLRRKQVLADVSLTVERGEVYGFLGPNGSGKTTSLKCLLGLLTPDSGEAEIFGQPGSDPDARRKLGYLPEHPYFYPHLTGRELVDYFGRLFDLPGDVRRRRTDELIELVGMTDRAAQPIKQYSKGMMQRIGMAQALINDPEVVILDEPMSGLDPIGRREVKDIILDLKARGTTVLFSSHILADAEALCDRVGLLFEGKIVRESEVDELLEGRVQYWDATCDDLRAEQVPGYDCRATQGDRLYFRIATAEELERWIDIVRQAGGRVIQVSPHRHTLEDFFIGAIRGDREFDDDAKLEASP